MSEIGKRGAEKGEEQEKSKRKEGKDSRRPNMVEKKIKWRLEEIVREEERNENRVWRG